MNRALEVVHRETFEGRPLDAFLVRVRRFAKEYESEGNEGSVTLCRGAILSI